MNAPVERFFETTEVLSAQLASALARRLKEDIDEQGEASLVVSGGSTPKPMLQALSRQNLEWRKVAVTLADERWVEAKSADSNERLVRDNLLVDRAAKARFVGMKNGAKTPQAGIMGCEKALASLPKPFSAVVLGMGDDGHTASLFPGAEELEAGLAPGAGLCIAVDAIGAKHQRMSMTLDALLTTELVVIHIVGHSKRDVYQKALNEGPVEELPIRAILNQNRAPVEVFWAP